MLPNDLLGIAVGRSNEFGKLGARKRTCDRVMCHGVSQNNSLRLKTVGLIHFVIRQIVTVIDLTEIVS
jgi:hypothetical protein